MKTLKSIKSFIILAFLIAPLAIADAGSYLLWWHPVPQSPGVTLLEYRIYTTTNTPLQVANGTNLTWVLLGTTTATNFITTNIATPPIRLFTVVAASSTSESLKTAVAPVIFAPTNLTAVPLSP